MYGIDVSALALAIRSARDAERTMRSFDDEKVDPRLEEVIDIMMAAQDEIEHAQRALLRANEVQRAEVFSALQYHLSAEELFTFVYTAHEDAVASHILEQQADELLACADE
jgi:hypothetical protein